MHLVAASARDPVCRCFPHRRSHQCPPSNPQITGLANIFTSIRNTGLCEARSTVRIRSCPSGSWTLVETFNLCFGVERINNSNDSQYFKHWVSRKPDRQGTRRLSGKHPPVSSPLLTGSPQTCHYTDISKRPKTVLLLQTAIQRKDLRKRTALGT